MSLIFYEDKTILKVHSEIQPSLQVHVCQEEQQQYRMAVWEVEPLFHAQKTQKLTDPIKQIFWQSRLEKLRMPPHQGCFWQIGPEGRQVIPRRRVIFQVQLMGILNSFFKVPPVRTASAAITRYILRKVRAIGAAKSMGNGRIDPLNFASSKTNGKNYPLSMWFY